MIIFTNNGYITQIFIMIRIAINNVISDTKKYQLIISCIEQVMINLNVFIKELLTINQCQASII